MQLSPTKRPVQVLSIADHSSGTSVAASKSASSYPSSHGKHCELPAGAKLPKEHDVHDADPTTSENVPGAHCTQELDAAADACPIGQSVQLIPVFSTSARPAVPGVAQ